MTTNLTHFRQKLASIWHILTVPILIIFTLLLLSFQSAQAEGSADFLIWQGKRLFLSTDQKQQLKVYAKVGEQLNVGASHVAVSGGTISVYNPSGVKVVTFDGKDGNTAIIFNDTQEKNGPTGGGSKNINGYTPGIIPITEEGAWTVTFDFPGYELKVFKNIEMQAPWTRAIDQPTIMRVILAYDVTVSQNGAANATGSKLLKGRVFTNEHVSAVNENGVLVNPSYYILTKDGYVYYVDFVNVDPWGFPISSNTMGVVNNNMKGAYRSLSYDAFTRDPNPTTWQNGKNYFYEPQAEDYGNVINNKIFFNMPSTDLPSTTKVTDIFRKNTHTTWLYSQPNDTPEFKNFKFTSAMSGTSGCNGNVTMLGKGGFIKFTTNVVGDIVFRIDMNNNNSFNDAVDLAIPKKLNGGVDSVFWNGKLGNGQDAPLSPTFDLSFMLDVQGGEIHIMMFDIENNIGGIKFKRLNGAGAPDSTYYYDHSMVGGTAGNPKGEITPYKYNNNWGNLKMLDYWTYASKKTTTNEKLQIAIVADCVANPPVVVVPGKDSDNDKIEDTTDLDDDNDGVSDVMEFCHNNGNGFYCLPSAKDPSADQDKDGIPNYLDASDTVVKNACIDTNNDGKCDILNPLYDTDFDQVPDHLDLDSDNDGITDLAEAVHNQPDANGDGVIDGLPIIFGKNGLYDPIDSDPNSLTAVITYIPTDYDKDAFPDHDDLDSDNDGINDVTEQGFSKSDLNEDGRLDILVGSNLIPSAGLAPQIDPTKTNIPIANPKDFDMDKIPDWHDFDSDNDGLNDVVEASRPDLDPDNDGRPGTGKPIVNDDGQPTKDINNKPLKSISDIEDTDKDGTPDWHDLDSDSDGIKDAYENDKSDPDNDGLVGSGTPNVNTKGQPVGTNSTPTDSDKDGKPDYRDLDSDDDTLPDATECAGFPCSDLDKDGKDNFRDNDRDNDGLWDGYECSTKGVACEDTDKDGTPDVDDLDSDNDLLSDNYECGKYNDCPDTDKDGTPDFRDLDSDEDTLPDVSECGGQATCGDLDKDGFPNFRDIDRDGDGLWDGYECTTKGVACEDTDKDGTPDVDDTDSDNDLLSDNYECGKYNDCPDTDKDGTPDFRDLDSDGDTLPDITECGGQANCNDLDKDGLPNFRDIDRDGDGINDGYECEQAGVNCTDTDKDGTPDVDDLDSDNDNLPDIYECGLANNCPDFDKDGIPDFRDSDSDGDGKLDKDECPQGAPCGDLDGDGFPNFRDKTCDKLLAQPLLTFQTPICNGLININLQNNYPNLDKIWWINGVGDTILTNKTALSISADSPEALSPYSLKLIDKDGCKTPFSQPAFIKVNISAKDNILNAADDVADTKQNTKAFINILVNDKTDAKNAWTISILQQPKNGKATIQSDMIVYEPNKDFEGEEIFEYQLCYKECSDICESAKVTIRVEKQVSVTSKDCTVPNIITPNGDGANDFLKIACIETYTNSELQVFNRWGLKVFNAAPYRNDWFGTYSNERLPAGTYFYIFKADRDSTDCQMGYITLMRE